MYQLLIFPAVKGGSAVAGAALAHAATSHLALLYANHAAATVGTHASAGHASVGHAAATHASRVLPAGHHAGTHPMMSLFDDMAISAAATVGALTFTNLYDHMLDELWASMKGRLSEEDMREQMHHVAYIACRHTKKALRRIHKLTADESARLNALRDELIQRLQSMQFDGLFNFA
jgi:hypothetical protein